MVFKIRHRQTCPGFKYQKMKRNGKKLIPKIKSTAANRERFERKAKQSFHFYLDGMAFHYVDGVSFVPPTTFVKRNKIIINDDKYQL